jgi:nucleotide-binding universal stress UspA family protein
VKRILVAINDSRPALAAATVATELAASQNAQLHFVTVTEPDGDTTDVIRHVADLAAREGLTPTSTEADGGDPFEVLLRVAREWHADLIVMGRSDKRRPGVPYVGSQTEHLLEFTHLPVLVVPDPTPPDPDRRPGFGR